jgi:uncharacterized protein YyaL (SSP411 family)
MLKSLFEKVRNLRLSFEERGTSYEVALRGVMAWLIIAQDATNDDGVAQTYFIKTKRWAASYPETTGYIISTFFDYAIFTKESEFRDRAIRMAKWEQAIQLPEGGIQASTIDAETIVATVFNTGMVILGWVRAYQVTAETAFLTCARRAAGWLEAVQDADGAWRKYGSPMTANALNTYNTRVAWALLEVDRVASLGRLREAARRNLEWALTQQQKNGWLTNNCFFDNAQPYTHTIAYAMRGFLESSVLLGEHRYLKAAEDVFLGLEPSIHSSGFLAGRFNRDWQPTVRYCCLTGNAQLALNGFRLYQLTGNEIYRESARRLLRYVLRTQNLQTPDLNVRGGVAGSWPIQGEYHPGQYPNWAAKFTADALMKAIELEGMNNR